MPHCGILHSKPRTLHILTRFGAARPLVSEDKYPIQMC